MAVNCSEILLNSSWMAVELPIKVAAIFNPLGGMSHTAVFTLFGILSTDDISAMRYTAKINNSPFNEVSRVLVLGVEHLLVHLLHGHSSTEHGSHCEWKVIRNMGLWRINIDELK